MTNFEPPKKKLVKIERQLAEVDGIANTWVFGHIILLFLAVFFGISGGVVLSLLNNDDNDSKVLCGVPTVVSQNNTPRFDKPYVRLKNGSYLELKIGTSGKNDDACAFTQFTLISSFIFGIIWMGFFLMCRRSKSSLSADVLPKPWRIVLPALVFSSIYAVVSFGASMQLTIQINRFCRDFDAQYSASQQDWSSSGSCAHLDKFLPINASSYSSKIQPMMMLGESMAWLTTIFWICSAGLCLLRMLLGPDFQVIILTTDAAGDTPRGSQQSGYSTLHSTSSDSPVHIGTSAAQVYAEPNRSVEDKAAQTRNRPRAQIDNAENPTSSKNVTFSTPE